MTICVCVCLSLATLLHGLGCDLGNSRECPLIVHYWTDLQSVHRFRCHDNIAPNAKYQQVLVLALSLVINIEMTFWQTFARKLSSQRSLLTGDCIPSSCSFSWSLNGKFAASHSDRSAASVLREPTSTSKLALNTARWRLISSISQFCRHTHASASFHWNKCKKICP